MHSLGGIQAMNNHALAEFKKNQAKQKEQFKNEAKKRISDKSFLARLNDVIEFIF